MRKNGSVKEGNEKCKREKELNKAEDLFFFFSFLFFCFCFFFFCFICLFFFFFVFFFAFYFRKPLKLFQSLPKWKFRAEKAKITLVGNCEK